MCSLLRASSQVVFNPFPTALGYIRDGKLRALAVTGPRRVRELPDIPALAEFLPGYEAGSWYGIAAPKRTPAEIVDKLNSEINAALADPAIKARFADLAAEPMPMTPAAFGEFIANETAKWNKVLKVANVKVN